jgi:hypothetical protein
MSKVGILVFLCLVSQTFAQSTIKNTDSPEQFLPAGYVITETIRGDLNRDGLEDYVFIIKATLSSRFVKDEVRGVLDRNRRGILIVFNQKNKFKLAYEGRDCFSSENEDGGVYFPPDLNIYIEKGNLLIHYAHGRYGYWRYNFRHENKGFVLIGYDREESYGPVLLRSVSINLLTKKILIKENTNPNYRPAKSLIKQRNLNLKNSIQLKNFYDFDLCKPFLLEC